MLRSLADATVAVSVHLLAAGLLVLAVGLVAGAGVPAALALAALAVGGVGSRVALARTGRAPLLDSPLPLANAWVWPTLALALVLAFYGASAGELRTVGGLVALVGLSNYFVRPLYLGTIGLVGRALSG